LHTVIKVLTLLWLQRP